jgi:hypothetical protein
LENNRDIDITLESLIETPCIKRINTRQTL